MYIYYIYRSTLSLLINMFAFWTDPAEYLPIDTCLVFVQVCGLDRAFIDFANRHLLGFCAGVQSGQGFHRLCQLTPTWFLCRCAVWTGPS